MPATARPPAARAIVEEVLGRDTTRQIWSFNYEKALPISVQAFDLTAVLPAVFYMFRFGQRRGRGKFLETFAPAAGSRPLQKRGATIEDVASRLIPSGEFEGFEAPAGRAILGDLLLAFCLENKNRALGRTEKIQRVAPTHYMASWVDLPDSVVHLRYVPEMVVATLATQEGRYVQRSPPDARTWFAVGRGFKTNVLLQAFLQGVHPGELDADLRGDRFDESEPVGLDQLLMIRIAQQIGQAPDKVRGGEGEWISNQRPVAERAAEHFSEDIRRFVRAYAAAIPRHALVELLESCVAVGLATIVTSVIEVLLDWAQSGEVPKKCQQRPGSLFVDCSQGIDRSLRSLAEQSMDDFLRRIERFPVVLMALRLLDHSARYDPKLKKRLKECPVPDFPYATEWLNLLGDILLGRRDEARAIFDDWERKANQLAERLEEEYPEAAEMLRDEDTQPNILWRLAETFTMLQGRQTVYEHVRNLVDSSFLANRPHGLATRRRVARQTASGGGSIRRDVRAVVLTDSVLDYLVHRHLLPTGNKGGYRFLAFKEFLRTLRERYGFCVDEAPPGMSISAELLRANRAVLERRLRDLGLLVGVNDAEAMKRLRPRFKRLEEDDVA